MDILDNAELKMIGAVENLEKRFTTIRAGRANPMMVNGINAEAYGSISPINQLATINVHDGKQLFIKPFDRNNLKSIEKALNEANLGINPTNNGEIIILTVPDLTEETRREYVKQAKEYAEDCKIVLRNIRQDANNDIKKLEISEDDIKFGQEDVQELINKYNKIVEEKLKIKENELMTV